jgi:predicted transcriptional regulator
MPNSPAPRLGDLERAVMEHLWARAEAGSEPVTVREVHEGIGAERALAYTTVMTVLDRLHKKGLVSQRRDGRAYRYAPAATREQLTAQTMRDTLGTLDPPDRRAAMLHFLDDATSEEIDDLRAALAALEARQGPGRGD